MTRKEIEKALMDGGLTCYEVTEISSSYGYGEMEIFVYNDITNIYLGHIELGACTALAYRNDELSKVEIENHDCFIGVKKMTIETEAGLSGFYFK